MAPPPSVLDVTLDYADLAAFVAGFEMITPEGIELPCPFSRSRGEPVRFVVRTLDRAVLLEGSGIVADVVDNGRHHPPNARYELAIVFRELSARSQVVVDRIQMAREFAGVEPTGVRKNPVQVSVPSPAPVAKLPVQVPAPSLSPAIKASEPLFPRSSSPAIRERVTSTGDLLEEVDEEDFLTPPPRPLPKQLRPGAAPPPVPRTTTTMPPPTRAPGTMPSRAPGAPTPPPARPSSPTPFQRASTAPPAERPSALPDRRTAPPPPTKAAPVPRTVGRDLLPVAPPRRKTGARAAVPVAAAAPTPAPAATPLRAPPRKKTMPGGAAVEPAKPRKRTGARQAVVEPEATAPRRRRTGQRAAVPMPDAEKTDRTHALPEEDATDRVPILPPRK